MAAVADATTVIETLIGRTLTAEQLQRIGLRFKQSDPYDLGVFADPDNPTNEELAQCFLDNMRRYGQDVVAITTRKVETENTDATIEAAVDTAVADFT